MSGPPCNDPTCRCEACVAEIKAARIARAHTEWRVAEVKRTDSGGTLYAPVSRSGGESGHCPSYNPDVVRIFVDQLNAREVRQAEQS